jgi:methionine-rich copper-binding protein CopC
VSKSPRLLPTRLPVALLLAAGAVLAGALTGPLPAAWAHAELIGSTPVQGATVGVVPQSATLTFTDPIDADFVKVAVTSPAGQATATAATSGPTVTVPLPQDGPGGYAVFYRVVSADGHPVSGELDFRVAGTPTAGPATAASTQPAGTGSAGTPTGATSPASTAVAAAGTGAAGSGSSGWMVGGAIVLAVAAGVGALVLARRPGRQE